MVVTEDGITTSSNAVQPSNTLVATVLIPCGNAKDFRLVQYMKALCPTLVTVAGIAILSIFMYLHKYAGITCTLSPNVNDVTCEFVL